MSEAYTLMHIPMRLVETVQGIASGSLVAVPREPTNRMWDAGRAQLCAGEGVLAIWRAMLAAAQEPGHE